MYTHCASGLVCEIGDIDEFCDFLRKETAPETHIVETTPSKKSSGLDLNSPEKGPKPGGMSMFESLGDVNVGESKQEAAAMAEITPGQPMLGLLEIDDRKTPKKAAATRKVAAATRRACKGERGNSKSSKQIGNLATRRKGGAAKVGGASGNFKTAKYRVATTLRNTGLKMPAFYSTPDEFGCGKCRYGRLGCEKCRAKKDWKLTYHIYDKDGKVELVWSKRSEEDSNELGDV